MSDRAMTEVFTAQAVVARPVEEVWARLADLERAPAWMPGVDRLRVLGPLATGTPVVFTARGKERTSTVTALEPGRSLTLRSVQGGVTADYTYTCTPLGGGAGGTGGAGSEPGTRVELVARTRMTGPVRLLAPVVRAAIRRADRGQVDAFARELTAAVG